MSDASELLPPVSHDLAASILEACSSTQDLVAAARVAAQSDAVTYLTWTAIFLVAFSIVFALSCWVYQKNRERQVHVHHALLFEKLSWPGMIAGPLSLIGIIICLFALANPSNWYAATNADIAFNLKLDRGR